MFKSKFKAFLNTLLWLYMNIRIAIIIENDYKETVFYILVGCMYNLFIA